MSNARVIYTDPKRQTDAEIIEILREDAGVNPPEGAKREELIELAKSQGLKVDGETAKSIAAAKKATEGKKPKAYVIEIPGAKDRKEVTGCVNGKAFRIQCDERITVSPAIMEVLRNAKAMNIEQVKNDNGQVVDLKTRDVPAVPVYVHETVF